MTVVIRSPWVQDGQAHIGVKSLMCVGKARMFFAKHVDGARTERYSEMCFYVFREGRRELCSWAGHCHCDGRLVLFSTAHIDSGFAVLDVRQGCGKGL